MSEFIVRQAFLTFTVGQVVYSDADAIAGRRMNVSGQPSTAFPLGRRA